MKQRLDLETEVKQQSQDQNDIYQYLRDKLKNNYVAIADLETKVWKLLGGIASFAKTSVKTIENWWRCCFSKVDTSKRSHNSCQRVPGT